MSNQFQAEFSTPKEPSEQLQNRFCVYFSGATGAKRTSIPIGAAFEKVFGEGNVISEPSYASVDWQDKKKYDDITKTMIEKIQEGKKITLVAFSGGVVELVDIAKSLVKKNPDTKFWADNLDVIIMAPPGIFSGAKEMTDSWHRFGQFAKSFLVPDFTSGLNSLYLTPPDPNIMSVESLAEKARKLLGKSNIIDGPPIINPPAKNIPQTNQEIKTQLSLIDQKLATTNNSKEFIDLLQQRTNLLSPQLQEKYDVFSPEGKPIFETAKIVGQELLGFARMFGLMVKGQVPKTIKNLHEMGVDLSFIVPEYDHVFPMTKENINHLFEFTDKQPEEAILALLALSAHHSWVMNPDVLVQAVKQKYE